ncbi:MAG: winged helix-turn-helix domain-containing protein [Acidobacteriia bacterium]|nr:winged helix-turn-helix domain-containing protein [Terriglobia bacterium]
MIWKTCQVRYHPRHVWRVLRSLGWSRQRPTRRAQRRWGPPADHPWR